MLSRIATLIVLALLTSPALAQEIQLIETCELTSMKLQQITQIYCADDLTIAPGAVIETQGFGLQIVVGGGTWGDLNIQAFDQEAPAPVDAAEVLIYVGLGMTGSMNIDNNGAMGGWGNTIEISVGAFAEGFRAAVDAGLDSSVTYLRATPLP